MLSDSIRASELRHVIHILSQSPKDGMGRPITTVAGADVQWTVRFKNVRAGISPAKATDVIRSGQTVSQVMIPITIRCMAGVTPNMRVQWVQRNGVVRGNYVIQGIIDEEQRDRRVVLMCLALGNQS